MLFILILFFNIANSSAVLSYYKKKSKDKKLKVLFLILSICFYFFSMIIIFFYWDDLNWVIIICFFLSMVGSVFIVNWFYFGLFYSKYSTDTKKQIWKLIIGCISSIFSFIAVFFMKYTRRSSMRDRIIKQLQKTKQEFQFDTGKWVYHGDQSRIGACMNDIITNYEKIKNPDKEIKEEYESALKLTQDWNEWVKQNQDGAVEDAVNHVITQINKIKFDKLSIKAIREKLVKLSVGELQIFFDREMKHRETQYLNKLKDCRENIEKKSKNL